MKRIAIGLVCGAMLVALAPAAGGRLKACALALAGCALLAVLAAAGPAGAQQRPNILVIVTDDQPAEGTLIVMPRTRAFFGDGGTRFVNAFATTPLCCPARASILAGRYAHNTGVQDNGKVSLARLDRSMLFPRLLRERDRKSVV